ncbi:MAG TPA: VOC family protein [Casimicrobiaceae bacterium]|nr:VOC family protein [Casimicrobiaceae bacterium]
MAAQGNASALVALDHVVVGATDLQAGCDYVEGKLGLRPQPGGKHAAMGTHNALLRLGDRLYLEVIAIDPQGITPKRPRWFDLDEPRMRASLAEGPRLIHYVARTDAIAIARDRCPEDLGPIHPMARGTFSWWMTIPDDGHLPGRGLVPTLIQWSDARHPADQMPDAGIRLTALAGEHPDPGPIRAALAKLGLSDAVKVTYGQSPRLAAMVRTPMGLVTI